MRACPGDGRRVAARVQAAQIERERVEYGGNVVGQHRLFLDPGTCGEQVKIHFFCMDLPHSDACFVKAYPEALEALLDGHVSAFAFFGGVPHSIVYDNTKLAVARILPDGTRERTLGFTRLTSHYVFKDRFGRPGKGNDKGKVEALVKHVRRTLRPGRVRPWRPFAHFSARYSSPAR